MNPEREAVLRYIDEKIAATNRRANDATTKQDHRYDLRVSAQTLGVLAGDLRAGIHETSGE